MKIPTIKQWLLLFSLWAPLVAFSADNLSLTGTWITIDDATLKPKSYVEIKEDNGTYHGTVIELLDGAKSEVCRKCSGENKDQPIVGMKIMWDMVQGQDEWWSKGKILDPLKGKIYNCKVRLINHGNKLEVRGFIGFSILGRSQTWHRKP